VFCRLLRENCNLIVKVARKLEKREFLVLGLSARYYARAHMRLSPTKARLSALLHIAKQAAPKCCAVGELIHARV
jgi:hypothetical protein